jgi:hypothetical protein
VNSTCWGWNLADSIDYSHFSPNGSEGVWGDTLTGSFSVRSSTFSWAFSPVALDNPHAFDQVTIGGAPGAGNTFSNTYVGIDLESAQSSSFDVSYNTSTATHNGMWVSYDPSAPTSPSQYLIHDNYFAASTGPTPRDGIYLSDNPTTPYIQAKVWNNTIPVITGDSGIDANPTTGAVITGNTITGTGTEGIGLWGATRNAVVGNNFGGFTVQSGGWADIMLGAPILGVAGPPNSTQNLVMCLRSIDTVLVQGGTGNTVIGCTKLSPEVTVAPLVRPSLKVKPKL